MGKLFKRVWGLGFPINVLILAAVLLAVLGGLTWLYSRISHTGYEKARAQYEANETQLRTHRDQLLGRMDQRDHEIAKLEIEKQAFKTVAEQGVKLDQEKAKQIELISSKEAQDLDKARMDMDCRDRARDTVALLRTAKPPINLDLAATIRKQCGQ